MAAVLLVFLLLLSTTGRATSALPLRTGAATHSAAPTQSAAALRPLVSSPSDQWANVANLTLPFGNFSQYSAYDSRTGDLWFTTATSFGVSPPTSDSYSTLLSLFGAQPEGIAFDSATSQFFFADQALNIVYVHSDADPTSNIFSAFTTVGSSPGAVVYDSGNGEVYVANFASSDVSVLDASGNDAVLVNITVQAFPAALAYDPALGEIFVADEGTGNVSVINDTTNSVVATIPVGSNPAGLAYDSAKNEIFVANFGSSNVSVIVGSSARVSSSISGVLFPRGLAYDPRSGEIFAAATGTDSLDVIADSNDSVVATVALGGQPSQPTYDPANGAVYVSVSGGFSFAIVTGAEPVTVSEVGLPAGSAWQLFLDGTNNLGGVFLSATTVTSSVFQMEAPGSYSLSVGTVTGFRATLSASAFAVSNAPVSVSVVFAPIFSVQFLESGLPAGSSWGLLFPGIGSNSTSTSSVILAVPNGTYAYSVLAPTGFVATVPNGTLVVAGGSTIVRIQFAAAFPVVFQASGLPVGAAWSVTLNGISTQSTRGTATFDLPNGSYDYTVGNSTGYTATPSHGTAVVAGRALAVPIAFSATTYTVAFEVSGLPAGDSWTVSFNGANLTSASSRLVYTGTAGSYSFLITAPAGYTATPAAGSATLSSGNLVVAIALTKNSTTAAVQVSSPGFDNSLTAAVGLGAGALGLAAGAVLSRGRSRSGAPPSAHASDDRTPRTPPSGGP